MDSFNQVVKIGESTGVYGLNVLISAVSSQSVCNATFGRTLQDNIAKVKSYRLSPADKYFKDLDSQTPLPNRTLEATVELPIIVTAASSNHYLESVEMLNSLAAVVRSAYPTIPVYYYDLGLELDQKIEVNLGLSSRHGLCFAYVLEPRRLAPSWPSQKQRILLTYSHLRNKFYFSYINAWMANCVHSK